MSITCQRPTAFACRVTSGAHLVDRLKLVEIVGMNYEILASGRSDSR